MSDEPLRTVRLGLAGDLDAVRTVPAILALRARGADLLAAKRAVEDVTGGLVGGAVDVPADADLDGLVAELREHGVSAAPSHASLPDPHRP